MASLSFELDYGVEVGKERLTRVVLGEITAGDVLDIEQEAERVVMTGQGPQLVSSPSLAGALTTCRHIKRLGNIEGPLELSLFRKMHPEDLVKIEINLRTLQAALAASRDDKQLAPSFLAMIETGDLQLDQELVRRGRDTGDRAGD